MISLYATSMSIRNNAHRKSADGDLHLDNVAHACWLLGNKNREQFNKTTHNV